MGLGEQHFVGGAGVAVGSWVVGPAVAAAVAAVVEREDVEAGPGQELRFEESVADVCGVAVAEQDLAETVLCGRRNPPPAKPDVVVGRERQLAKRRAGSGWDVDDLPGREVEKRGEDGGGRQDGRPRPRTVALSRLASRAPISALGLVDLAALGELGERRGYGRAGKPGLGCHLAGGHRLATVEGREYRGGGRPARSPCVARLPCGRVSPSPLRLGGRRLRLRCPTLPWLGRGARRI